MDHRNMHGQGEGVSAYRLSEEDLEKASGGTGYSSIQCKRCGKAFADMDAYRAHVAVGCTAAPKR